MSRWLLSLLFTLVLVAPASAAKPLSVTPVAPSATNAVSDGVRWLAWLDAAQRPTVLDVGGTGARTTYARPCVFFGPAAIDADGVVLFACNSYTEHSDGTLVYPSGLQQPIAAPVDPWAGAVLPGRWTGLGSVWAVFADTPHKGGEKSLYVNRATGAVRLDDGDRDHALDLNSPALNPALPCAQIKRDYPVVLSGRRGLTITPNAVKLQRCGRPTQVLERCRCANAALDGSWAAWERSNGAMTRIYRRSLGSGATRTAVVRGAGQLFLLNGRLFAQTDTGVVEIS